jgi:hypothetical protein
LLTSLKYGFTIDSRLKTEPKLMEVSMNSTNREVIAAIHTAVPASDQMDAFVLAYQSGDLMELGRLTAALYNQHIADQRWRTQSIKDDFRYDLTAIGQDQADAAGNAHVHPMFQGMLARFQGGVL